MKIVVVGNIAGGKTRLSRRLAKMYQLPVTHVDSLQFLPGMKIRPLPETRKALKEVAQQNKWLIDGYGPLDLIEQRFNEADFILFIDLPLWRHRWWCLKRQVFSLWQTRVELPKGCNEFTWQHTKKLFRTLHSSHKQMRPELLRIFSRETLRAKVTHIRSMKEWNQVYEKGLPERFLSSGKHKN